ncbi:uncharacterized mitochondrial protein-like protein, partial [Tanacetum coccineum]
MARGQLEPNGSLETRKMIEELSLETRQDWLNKVKPKKKALIMMRAWSETLSTYLIENGFRRGTIDKTLFIKKDKGDILLVHVYVDDIIFGSTKKSLCNEFEGLMHKRFQMSSIGELTFFLGLQVQQKEDGIFISQDKYMAEILKKFDFATVKTASTPIDTNKALVKDEEAEAIDVHLYRSMIGSLMYLTTSRSDIMFAICACARFQVTPKTSHIHTVKIIFRYMKGQPKLGLWYPRDSPFDFEAFSNSDYAGASLDRKSTTGGCQFLGRRLISWQCKKQTIVANSTTEAEYVAAVNCYENVYKEWEDIMERAATTASSLEAEHDSSNINRTQSMATLNESFPQGTDSGSGPRVNTLGSGEDSLKLNELMELCTKLSDVFWATTKVKTVNGERQLQALVDKKTVIITETTIISDLNLEDAGGTDCLPTDTIFEELARMGVESYNGASLGAQEDASKQGRKIIDLDVDAEVTLMDETQEINDDNLMFDTDVLEEQDKDVAEKEVSVVDPVTTAGEVVITANVEVTTVNAPTTTIDELTLAQTLIE